MNEGAPIIRFRVDPVKALQAFRDITNTTNERTVIVDNIPQGPVGNNAPIVSYRHSRAVLYALVLGNKNSLPLDWAARISVGGTHLSFFILKQLPVLPPRAYLKSGPCSHPWVQLVVPRVLELTYTSEDMASFANDLGFEGPPFPWVEERRHRLRCQLDAIFAHMYGLDRSDLEYILDAPAPSSSFPILKQHEIKAFGEYRTQRLVLQAFDSLERGEVPCISTSASP